MPIAFRHEPQVTYGVLQPVSARVRRIVARNASAFTYHGTGTYVIGRGEVAVVDPGPDLPSHVDALLAALDGERITHLLVTHTHIDHSPATRLLRERTGAPAYAFGPHPRAQDPAAQAGADLSFVPDVIVGHGDVIEADGFSFECVHTPGHCSNHLCFALREEQALFSGDHVMGWSTTMISPPDGAMGAYLRSLELLLERDDRVYLPAHGPALDEPQPYVRALIAHRRERELQIVRCLERGVQRIAEMVPIMYQGTPPALFPAAARSVLAHVRHMLERGTVELEGEGPADLDCRYRLR